MPLEVRGLTAGIGAVRILHGLDLDVATGSAVALIGSNGAGKSTPVSYTHLTLPTILLV